MNENQKEYVSILEKLNQAQSEQIVMLKEYVAFLEKQKVGV